MTDARLRRVKSTKGRRQACCIGTPSTACRVSRLSQAGRRRQALGAPQRRPPCRVCRAGQALSRLQPARRLRVFVGCELAREEGVRSTRCDLLASSLEGRKLVRIVARKGKRAR